MKKRIKELTMTLNKASKEYHNGTSVMEDKEYDSLFDELVELEKKSGIILPDSPTQKVGAEVVDFLPSFKHKHPMLSLDKTKDVELMHRKFKEGIAKAWESGYDHSENVVIMPKMDGSTIVAYYEDGELAFLVTRGNGERGNSITHNAKYIKGLPMKLPMEVDLIVRGEAVMSYAEFERINAELHDEGSKYKNPRNLATASIQLLDSREFSKREVCFKAFDVFGDNIPNIFSARLEMLEVFGFDTVRFQSCPVDELTYNLGLWTEEMKTYEFPTDGLVVCMEDVMYADTLPGTGHNPNIMRGYALKWADDSVETTLRDIEWSASKTGLLNPVAVFDPVELCGTTVTRASLHNLSYIADLDLRVGDKITVYKANMIIPQVEANLDKESRESGRVKVINSYLNIAKCPVCGEPIGIEESVGGTFLARCTNPFCAAKKVGEIVHMCERDCLDIKGLSEEKVSYLLNHSYINSRYDLFIQARNYEEGYGILNPDGDDLEEQEGWGKQSVKNLADAINKARETDFVSFIHSMAIPNVGKGQAKLLKGYMDANYDKLAEEYGYPYLDGSYDLMGLLAAMEYGGFDFSVIEGFGEVIANSLSKWVGNTISDMAVAYLDKDDPAREVVSLLEMITFSDVKPEIIVSVNDAIKGKTFVITGSLNHYKNRDELVSVIESLGGKVAGSVSSKTDFLINNDTESMSSKNKKAKELGVKIISEADFNEMK